MIGALAVITTGFLFLTMKLLVTGKNYELEDAATATIIDFVRVERDEAVNDKSRHVKRPAKPEPDEPPPPPKLSQVERPTMDNVSMAVDFGQFEIAGLSFNAPVDGDALAIVRVPPRYPSRALARGIEGWVLLEFTIDEIGQAVNPIVLESDPPHIFDVVAIVAVKKWKYRPMMENGRAVPRPGVRQIVSFEIAK